MSHRANVVASGAGAYATLKGWLALSPTVLEVVASGGVDDQHQPIFRRGTGRQRYGKDSRVLRLIGAQVWCRVTDGYTEHGPVDLPAHS